MPKHKKISYFKLVVTIRPLKTEVNRVRVTIGDYRPDHKGHKSSDPAAHAGVKIHLNNVISESKSQFMTMGINVFYYGTPTHDY